jgi:di/tricarboxylate transporter
MTLQIGLTLAVIVITLIAFIKEWAAPDVVALSVLCLLVALGVLDSEKADGLKKVAVPGWENMLNVFKNDAPLTIAALFVIGGALETSGAVDHIGRVLRDRLPGNMRLAILAFSGITAFFSAFMNNTAIVAIMLPATLGFARSKNIAASRFLMPLSYASILGGCCTLIGTSTNLAANSALKQAGVREMTMFELTPIGIPLAIAGIVYLTIFGPKLIPARSSITGSLDISNRTSPLYHILVSEGSSMIGKKLIDTALASRESGSHVMEVRRNGTRLMQSLSEIVVQKNDRFLMALHRRRGAAAKPEVLFEEIGVQLLSTVDGIVSELVVRDESSLLGKTLAAVDFRQHYNCVVLAVHRGGVNITNQIAKLPLDEGDTLLVITARNNLNSLDATRDFVLTDAPEAVVSTTQRKKPRLHVILSCGILIGVVLVATLTDVLSSHYSFIHKIPIHYAALVGALALVWFKVLSPREAYASIDWQVLFMLYGLLGLGLAMENTGTAKWLAGHIVDGAKHLVSAESLPLLILWLLFILTLCLTEILSNTATAAIMIPIALKLALGLNVDSRAYIICVTVAASTAFAIPMGYQTHMMVYGPGGYKFTDFLKVGIPLNLLCWVVSCLLIPLIWPLVTV